MTLGPIEMTDGGFAQRNVGMATNVYDSAAFVVTTATTDYDVDTQQATLFSNVDKAYYTEIRTDQTISVKLNDDANAEIVIAATDSPYVIDQVAVTNLFISNASGSSANINVMLV